MTKSELNKLKAMARNAVTGALANGSLVKQPCYICGAKKVDAHHDDYSKPLDVRWLCRVHHREYHEKIWNQNNGDGAPRSSFRKRSYDKDLNKLVAIRVSDETHVWLEEQSNINGISQSEFIRSMLDQVKRAGKVEGDKVIWENDTEYE